MRLALTGASGFIGGQLLAALLADGHQVQTLYRRPPADHPAGLCPVPGDLLQPASLVQLCAGADLVLHLAGAVRGHNRAAFMASNCTGTSNLLAAAAPGTPLLLMSSLAASQPGLSHYSASKAAGEQLLRRQATGPWTIVRPPAVYGPGDQELRPLFRCWAAGVGIHLHNPGARLSLLHVADLVGLVRAWIQRHADGSAAALHQAVLEPDDGTAGGHSWRDLLAAARSTWDLPRLVPVPVPAPLLWPLALALELAGRLGAPAPMLSRAKLRELDHRQWLSDPRSCRKLLPEWQPQLPPAAGLRQLAP